MFAAHIGCSTESTWKIVDCLKRGRSFLELGADFKVILNLFNKIYDYKIVLIILFIHSLKSVLMLGDQ